MDAITEFKGAMRARELTPPETIIPDGRLHRFASSGRRGDTAGWYVYHDDGIPAGAFGDWRTGINRSWRSDVGRVLTPAEEAAHQRKVDAMQRARDADQARRHAWGRDRAREIWKAAPRVISHPYLKQKRVQAHGLRVYHGALTIVGLSCDGSLIVPARDTAGAIHTLQFINAHGLKLFLPAGNYTPHYYSIGRLNGTLCIAEGFATGATVHEATGHAVAVAFNAGNLLSVAVTLRAKFPNAKIILCADNDRFTPGNPGVASATEAARAVSGLLAVPRFDDVGPYDYY